MTTNHIRDFNILLGSWTGQIRLETCKDGRRKRRSQRIPAFGVLSNRYLFMLDKTERISFLEFDVRDSEVKQLSKCVNLVAFICPKV